MLSDLWLSLAPARFVKFETLIKATERKLLKVTDSRVMCNLRDRSNI